MSIVLALASALLFGTGDFYGGLASRRTSATAVIVCSQLIGLLVLVPALILIPSQFDLASVAWGAGGGLAGSGALLLFLRSLALGAMSVAAPLTALGSASVPVLIGFALGERVSTLALVGMSIAIVAAVLISAEGGRLPGPRQLLSNHATGGALAAGALFGLFFVLLAQSNPASGLWSLAGGRASSITLMIAVGLLAQRPLRPERSVAAAVIIAGLADMTANVLFLLSTRLGMLSTTAVLIALYPAVIVILARVRLHEKAHAIQLAGFAAAAVAVTCIALG
jgi:drug/metabolite transporter (DMT)-like permease